MYYTKSLLKKIGDALREQREKLGWTLDQASKESGLSKTMCFRLERGDDTTKINNYETYCAGLGLIFNDLCNDLQGVDLLKQELSWIEADIDLSRGRGWSEAIKSLKGLNIPSKHPYMMVVEFLKGKTYFYAKKYNKAEKALRRAIDLADKHINEYAHLNIITSAYNVLSNVFYYAWHRYEQALEAANEAAALFVEGGERQIEYYMSLVNKSVYLEKLKRLTEAEKIVRFLWENLQKIYKSDTQAAVCELMARICKHNKQYQEAREAIQMGIDISRRNNLPHRASDLLLVWGSIHEEHGEEKQAEQSYLRALKFLPTIRVYNALGNLYLNNRVFEKALDAFSKSLEFDVSETRPHYVDALIGIGKVHILQGQKGMAVEPLEKAESLVDDMKEKKREIQSLLAECYKDVDPAKYLYYLEKAQNIQLEAILK